jgi:hypothetical protein
MRLNIYHEELTNETEIVETKPIIQLDGSERVFYGARLYLKSHPALHHSDEDDDRSAITFWVGTRIGAEMMCEKLKFGLQTLGSKERREGMPDTEQWEATEHGRVRKARVGEVSVISGETYAVKPTKCELNEGYWRCITHEEGFTNGLQKDFHIGRGDHTLAWVCYEHGLEVP